MRKLLSLFLAVVMLMAAVPAALAAEPYTLDIWWVGNADNPEVRAEVEAAINEYIEPKIDAHVSFHIIPWDDWKTEVVDVLTDKASRKAAKMDLVFTADWEYYPDLVEAKALLQLGDQLEQNGQGILESLSESFFNGIKVNGDIYGVPTNKELCVPQGFIVNKTAAEAIGWDYENTEITCTADLEPWLQKYKEKYPARFPYLMDMSPAGRWVDEPWINDWSGLTQNALAMKMAVGEDGKFDETVYSIYETPEQEAHIRLMYAWAQKGYIAPDAATYNYNEIFGTGDFLVFTQPLKGNNIKAVEMYTANHPDDLPPFECVEIILQDKYKVTTQAGGSMFAIPMSAKYKEKAMQYLNLMHSDETLVNLMLFGREGVNYNKVNDRQVEKIDDAHWWYGLHGGAWTVGNTKLQYVLTDEDPDKNALLQEFAVGAPKTASYGFRFDKTKAPKLVDAVKDAAAKFARPLMVGAVDPDDPELGLEAFRKALKDAGIDELKTEVERQYNEWKDWMK